MIRTWYIAFDPELYFLPTRVMFVFKCTVHTWYITFEPELYFEPTRVVFVLQCMVHTWYIAVDAQLYFLSPVLLIPLQYWPRFGLGLTFAALIAAFFTSFGISYAKEEHVGIYRNYTVE
jgi:peptidoglycan/LPS O-acetylase OafA/YrhL